MSVESTRAAIRKCIDSQHTDLGMMAEDIVFTNMSDGEQTRGVDGVRQMLHWICHVAFDARGEFRNAIVADQLAMIECDFVGTHTGAFADIPAARRSVRVPRCVVYDLENDKIKRGRVYMAVPAMLRQRGVTWATADSGQPACEHEARAHRQECGARHAPDRASGIPQEALRMRAAPGWPSGTARSPDSGGSRR